MKKYNKIYIAGHRGLVGGAIKRELERKGYTNLVYRTHSELDLKDSKAVAKFFEKEKPEYVVLSAAKVGGIYGNNTYPVEFFTENMKIQLNVIENSYKSGVKKLLFLGSSCIYPKNAPQPMKEEYLLSDYLEKTNEMYALAKIAGLKLCASYNREYGTNYMCVMPCNLYGIGDNYHPQNELNHLLELIHEYQYKNKYKNYAWIDVQGLVLERVKEAEAFLDKYCPDKNWRLDLIDPNNYFQNKDNWFKNFYQNIFSVKNENIHKVVRILGFKISFRRKQYINETTIINSSKMQQAQIQLLNIILNMMSPINNAVHNIWSRMDDILKTVSDNNNKESKQ